MFRKFKHGKLGLSSACKNCLNTNQNNVYSKLSAEAKRKRQCQDKTIKRKYDKRYYIKSLERNQESVYWKQRNNSLKVRYGISLEEFQELESSQNNKCAVCLLESTEQLGRNKKAHLYVDHDHKTSKIRGLLCRSCNFGIGQAKDGIKILNSAIEYLRGEYTTYAYPVSRSQYKKLCNIQRDICKICGEKDIRKNRDGSIKLVIDHCHETNVVRGLLCNPCNTLLGSAKDSVEILHKMTEYLQK